MNEDDLKPEVPVSPFPSVELGKAFRRQQAMMR